MTEQEKRENVIKGLECAIDPDHFGFKNCHDCFYRKDVDHLQYVCDGDRCISDALALLKAQVEEIKALRQLVEWAEECGFGLDNILWREYVTEEELDSIDGYVEQMIYVARKAVNGNA